MVEWTPAEHLAENTGLAHEMLKTLKTTKTKSEKILHALVRLNFCKDGGVRYAGSTQKVDLSGTVKTLTTKSPCLFGEYQL